MLWGGEGILFVANQMMDYVSLWTKPGTENSPSSFQRWWGLEEWGVSCGVSSFDDSTFPTGPLQTHHGELSPLRTLPLRGGRQRQDGAGPWGGCLQDASSQVRREKSAHSLLSFKYQNKGIQFYSFQLKLMDNEMQDQSYAAMQFKAPGKALFSPSPIILLLKCLKFHH